MTTSLRIETYEIANDHFTWLTNADDLNAIVVSSFKYIHPLNQEVISQVGNILIDKAAVRCKPTDSFFLLIRRLNSGTKVDRYKGIWKLDFLKEELVANARKDEWEIFINGSIFNVGIIELPVSHLEFALRSLVVFPEWSFIVLNVSDDFFSLPLDSWLSQDMISNREKDVVLNTLLTDSIFKHGSFVRYGDGGDDWEFALLQR